ncbi:TetR family transcriptional regulator [Nocardia fluminea]|uniref:TetR family transcriptional regulator n=1 Tax=Nocardia fluminea TaxID=134984 RepID=A0A2N3VK62_9NOCA|nr:TetR family transcriptional regulator [Nocardia fluminea]
MISGPVRAKRYGGDNAEERTERRRLALIDAALAVSAEESRKRLTVDRVCQRAKLSKRYFYESFADVDALTEAVFEHVAAGVIDALSTGDADHTDVAAFVHTTTGAFVHYLTDDPRRARALFGELLMTEASNTVRAWAMQRIAAQVIARAREVHHIEPTDPLITTTAAMLIGGAGQAIIGWLDGNISGGRDLLIDNLARLILITGNGAAATARTDAPQLQLPRRSKTRTDGGMFEADPIDVARDRYLRKGLGKPDLFLAMSSVLRLHRRMTADLDQALRPLKLTTTSYMLLITVRFSDDEAMSLVELSRALIVHPATVTLLVDQLEKLGLIERRPSPRDRRATLATLTDKGRTELSRATDALERLSFGLPGTDPAGAYEIVEALRTVRVAAGDTPDK